MAALGVAKDETGAAVDGDFITVFELAALVAANNSLVDKRTVAGEILDDGDGV